MPGLMGERRTPSYTAFVLAAGRRVQRVELGPAKPIDAAVAAWRKDIIAGRSGTAADQLCRLVWRPLHAHLPEETQTVVFCPDGSLTALPWSALPGKRDGTVLLEDYALAVVPYGQFLLDQLRHAPSVSDQGILLAVGDVDYDTAPTGPTRPTQLATRSAIRGEERLHWNALPGTKRELDQVAALVADEQCVRLSGREASSSRVLAELPKARWAHFATHGFFADPRFRSALQVDETYFEGRDASVFRERTTVAGRNPLVLSGLLLTGANVPHPIDDFGLPQGDGGILSAEAIAGLSLRNLELAVLSACETGLGDVAGGEGIYGLQRAFHIAGTRNVVASLWKVDDQATQALMDEFYKNLWEKKLGKLESLRQAQLTMLREYDPKEGRIRGTIRRLKTTAPKPEPQPKERETRLPPYYWAAFTLSGDYRKKLADEQRERADNNALEAIEPSAISAPRFLIETILANPGEITVIAVGPYTNLMIARLLEPRIVVAVRDIIVMGGAAGFASELGNATIVGEANVINDPHVAGTRFRYHWPVTMVGLDVTYTPDGSAGPEYMERLAAEAGEAGAFLERINRFYMGFYERSRGVRTSFQLDSIAVSYGIDPGLFETRRGKIQVINEGVAKGQTIFCPEGHHEWDAPGWQGLPTHTVCSKLNGPLYRRTLVEGTRGSV